MRAFHSFDALGIAGLTDEARLKDTAELVFRHAVAGRTLIDIGAWDGWYSFEAERRGANVTACDWFCWGGPGWGTREIFDFVRRETKSAVRDIECDIPQLHPNMHGAYDVVLLLGVLYHVTDIHGVLSKVADLCREHLVIESATMPGDVPAARYWRADTLNGDGSNYWTPSVSCVEEMLRDLGFTRFETHPTPHFPQTSELTRHIIHAWR